MGISHTLAVAGITLGLVVAPAAQAQAATASLAASRTGFYLTLRTYTSGVTRNGTIQEHGVGQPWMNLRGVRPNGSITIYAPEIGYYRVTFPGAMSNTVRS